MVGKVFNYIQTPWIYNSNILMMQLPNISVADCSFHPGGKGLLASEILIQVSYMGRRRDL